MAKWHLRSKRTSTGARVKRLRKKKRFEAGSGFLETKIGKRQRKKKRVSGGNVKFKLLAVESINVADTKTGKIQRAKILSVHENTANPHFVRRNVITKGAIVETEVGLARITSRPGQHGMINAVIVEEKKSGK